MVHNTCLSVRLFFILFPISMQNRGNLHKEHDPSCGQKESIGSHVTLGVFPLTATSVPRMIEGEQAFHCGSYGERSDVRDVQQLMKPRREDSDAVRTHNKVGSLLVSVTRRFALPEEEPNRQRGREDHGTAHHYRDYARESQCVANAEKASERRHFDVVLKKVTERFAECR